MKEVYVTYIISFAFIFGGVLAGVFFEYFLLNRLRKAVLKTKWSADDLVINALKGLLFVLAFLAGAYFAVRYLYFSPHIQYISGRIMFSALVLIVTIFIARLVVGMIRSKAELNTGLLRTGSIMANIVRITIYVIGVLIILQGFGVSITPMLTALGVGGLAVALALQDTLSNLFSGIQIIASKQVRAGDYIKLDSGEEGYVTDITWRNTTIRMLSNNLVVVPNSKIASAILTNYYLPDKEVSVLVESSVSYDSDLKKVEAITVEAAAEVIQKVQGTVKTHEPFIRYHTFSDSGISFSVILRGAEFTDQYLIKHEFIKTLHERYRQNGIEIPYPTRTVYMHETTKKDQT